MTRSTGSWGVSHGKTMNQSSAAAARTKMIVHASLLVTPPGRCRQSHRYMCCLLLGSSLRPECRIPCFEGAEHDDAVGAGPRGIAGDECDHRLAGVLPGVTRDRI